MAQSTFWWLTVSLLPSSGLRCAAFAVQCQGLMDAMVGTRGLVVDGNSESLEELRAVSCYVPWNYKCLRRNHCTNSTSMSVFLWTLMQSQLQEFKGRTFSISFHEKCGPGERSWAVMRNFECANYEKLGVIGANPVGSRILFCFYGSYHNTRVPLGKQWLRAKVSWNDPCCFAFTSM